MKRQELKKWQDLTQKILNDAWQFKQLCKKPFDRGFIGELLVLNTILKTYGSDICNSPNSNFVYAGSANKKWDISLTLGNKTIFINAKSTTMHDKNMNPLWVRQNAKTFCDINIDTKTFKQFVSLKKESEPNLFYVFVDTGGWLKNHEKKLFTLSDKEANLIFGKDYLKSYHKKVRKSKSTDFWIKYKDIKKYEDNKISRIFK